MLAARAHFSFTFGLLIAVVVPVLLNLLCLVMLLRAACKRLRERNGPQQGPDLESPTDAKCPKQPAVQVLTHLVIMHPDHQVTQSACATLAT